MCCPVAVDPVKETLRTRGSVTRASPSFAPGPVTTESTPAGIPASVKQRARDSAVSGVVLAGLSTTAFPAARAGASARPLAHVPPISMSILEHQPVSGLKRRPDRDFPVGAGPI
jgi:hypothetical protein